MLLFWYYELSRFFRSAYGSALAVLRSDHPVVKRISSLPLRLLVAAPFVLLTAADMSISLYSWCTFGTTFNDGFAISVLQSDPDEVVKMLGMYIPYLCAFAFLSLLFLAVIIKYDVSLPTKKSDRNIIADCHFGQFIFRLSICL